ncbi:hypothetical protein H3C61_01610 [Candidatus Gracilibacteria bacterium]|nr:hypothetical protein [Candidatus Gracilibacteria bacterium]
MFNKKSTQKVVNQSLEILSEELSYEDLKSNIDRVFLFIKEYDFFEVYKYVFVHLVKDIKYAGDNDFSSLEYLISIISSIPESEMKMKKPSKRLLKDFFKDFSFLGFKITDFFSKQIEDDFVRNVKASFLTVKGNDYNQHLYDYNIGLFKDFNGYLSDTVGFNIENLIDFYNQISETKLNNFSFIFSPNNDIEKNILEYFSLTLGDNNIFNEGDFGGFYGNKSYIYNKPFLKFKNQYYILVPIIFLRNLKSNIENILKKDNKIWQKYAKKRGEYLEKQSIKYLSNILPGSISYNGLKYELNGIIYETDGILIYDNNLFILEAKSGILREASKNGALIGLNEDIDKIVSDAYYQAIRTREYIDGNSKALFKNKLGKEVILNGNEFNKIFLLNITGDYLGQISLYTNNLIERGNIDYKYDFLPIYLNILRIYSEITEFPSQFILFLERRLNLINRDNIRFSDELDMFIYFNRHGLIFPYGFPPNHEGQKSLYVHIDPSLSHEVDMYYYGNNKIKPKMNINIDHKSFIKSIESINKKGFSEISNIFLGIGWNYLKPILLKLRKKVLKDGYIHTGSYYFNDFGILFIIYSKDIDISSFTKFSKSKLDEKNIKKMYNVFIKFNKKSFLEFYKKNSFTPMDFEIIN